MLTAEGCLQRRVALWQALDPPPEADYLLLSDPIHLMYLANFYVDPISLGGGFPGLFAWSATTATPSCCTMTSLPHSVEEAHVEERRPVAWYDGQSPAMAHASLPSWRASIRRARACASTIGPAIRMPRSLSTPSPRCAAKNIPTRWHSCAAACAATEAGHAWARANVQARHDRTRRLRRRQRAPASRPPGCRSSSTATSRSARARTARRSAHHARPQGRRHVDPRLFRRHRRLSQRLHQHAGRRQQTQRRTSNGSTTCASKPWPAAKRNCAAAPPCLTVYQAVRGAFEKAGMADYLPPSRRPRPGPDAPRSPVHRPPRERNAARPATSSRSNRACTSKASAASASRTIT